MAIEIERRFLIANDEWQKSVESHRQLIQGYVVAEPTKSVRVRIADDLAWLTIKQGKDVLHRVEFEFPIPAETAREMVDQLCGTRVISKVRHIVPAGNGLRWEIDVFGGQNQGLTIAEVELPSVDTSVEIPHWIGQEITADRRYLNSQLVVQPWNTWSDEAKAE